MSRKDGMSRRRACKIAVGFLTVERLSGPGGLRAQEMPPATRRRLKEMTWQPLKSDFFPPGLEVKAIYEDKTKNTSLSVVRYPKGYKEPRHYHKGCGHWLYFLRGRLRDPETVYEPGTFVHAPPGNIHGPFTAEQETEGLFFVDGPFDVFGA